MKEELEILKDDINNANISTYAKKELEKKLEPQLFNKPSDITIKGHFDFESLEEDIVNYYLYNIKKINKINDTLYQIDFTCDEIIKFFKIPKNKDVYENIKQAFKNIRDKSIWWYSEHYTGKKYKEIKQITFSFFSAVECETREDLEKTGKLKKNQRISSKIKVLILSKSYDFIMEAFSRYFATFNIMYIHNLKNKNYKRLYQILYAYIKQKQAYDIEKGYDIKNKAYSYYIKIDDLRQRLSIKNKYIEIKEFKRFLKKMVDEINNQYNEITIFYYIKKEIICFAIKNKDYAKIEDKEIKKLKEMIDFEIIQTQIEEQKNYRKNETYIM